MLSIYKNINFRAPHSTNKTYLSLCAQTTNRELKGWNAEFQSAVDMDDHTPESATLRYERFCKALLGFEESCRETVRAIVEEADGGPSALADNHTCFHERTVFYKIFPDARAARNHVSSLRAVLAARIRGVTVPLTVLFMHCGVPVVAQEVIPIPHGREPWSFNGGAAPSGVPTDVANMIECVRGVLNKSSPNPDRGDGEDTIEVVKSLDGRLYVTSASELHTTLFPDDPFVMKRTEYLVRPNLPDKQNAGSDGVIAALESRMLLSRMATIASMPSGTPVETTNIQKSLIAVMHAHGVNVCLLKPLYNHINQCSDALGLEAVRTLRQVIAIEMLCRAAKDRFYLESQAKRFAYNVNAMNAILSRTLVAIFEEQQPFCRNLLVSISKNLALSQQTCNS